MGIVLLCVIGLVIMIFLYRYIHISIIKNQHKITTENGIDEVVIKEIGGIEQYFYIRGQNEDNPVILMINGGMPMIPMLYLYQYDWENSYTVVNWDRRGSGETYFLNQEKEEEMKQTMQDERLIADIGEAVDYVYERFGDRKIILLADSMGTTLAPRYVMEHPEKILCYIGSAQVTDLAQGMELCAADAEGKARQAGNEKDAKAVAELAKHTRDKDAFIRSYNPIIGYGERYVSGTNAWTGMRVYMQGLNSPYFPIAHLSYYFKSDELLSPLLPYLEQFNIADYGTDYQVPVFFILGEKDCITKYNIEDYYIKVNAPIKNLYYIPNAGHDALQQNPQAFFERLNQAVREAMRYSKK